MATVPKQLATPENTFTALALQFNFEQRIKDKIIELGIRTIAEFRHYARSEDEIKKLFIDTIKDPAYEEMQGRLQAARPRFAWTACKALLDSEHGMGCATGLRYPSHPKTTAHYHLRGRTTTAPFRAVRAARRPDVCHGFPPEPYTT